MSEIEIKIAESITSQLLGSGQSFRVTFTAKGMDCWVDFEPGSGKDVIADYHGPDDIMWPLLQRAHDIAEQYS